MIKISGNNRQEAYAVVDGKYEYKKVQLEDYQSKYIYIPMSVITDTSMDTRRVGVLSYLKAHCGLNNIVGFTIPDIVEWCGGKPDRRANGTNDKVLSTIDILSDRGYLTYLTETSKSSYIKCKFDTAYYGNECSDGYAAIYLDELEKIMTYQKENSNDRVLNNTTILLVFSYFRNKIRRRPNELKPEERTSDGIKDRRERIPDAYDDNINNISDDLGISSKTVSKIIDILEYELELIVTDRAYRVKNEDNEFRTFPTIFANAYKREHKYQLIVGENYSRNEIELKANNMRQYYQKYEIDKRKRKQKGGETK